ncbi:MAG: hypothetical protein ACK53Y_07935, partial [bacterium]
HLSPSEFMTTGACFQNTSDFCQTSYLGEALITACGILSGRASTWYYLGGIRRNDLLISGPSCVSIHNYL